MPSFGRCTPAVDAQTATAAGRHYGDKFTLAEAGVVQSMSVYCQGGGGSNATIRLTIYDDDGAAGVQGTLLGYTVDMTITPAFGPAFLSGAMVAPVALTPGDYWLCWQAADANALINLAITGQQYRGSNGGDAFADGPANPFVGTNIVTGDRLYAVCATYALAGGFAPGPSVPLLGLT